MMGIDFSGGFEEMRDQPEPAKSNGHDRDAAWPLLEPAAYHGLAGEVVARILPDTESDPAALLLQSASSRQRDPPVMVRRGA